MKRAAFRPGDVIQLTLAFSRHPVIVLAATEISARVIESTNVGFPLGKDITLLPDDHLLYRRRSPRPRQRRAPKRRTS